MIGAPVLRFGDLVAKAQASAFYRRQARRGALVENILYYHERWVPPEKWPDEKTPASCWPKCFRKFPLSLLEEGARRLQEKRAKMVESPQSR